MENSIDWKFIHEREGGSKTEAYLPVCSAKSIANIANKACYGKDAGSVIGKSGVTIAAGFDLGQRNTYDLDSLKLPPHLNQALKPFLGKKKEEAQQALEAYELEHGQKLMITGTDAQLINQRVKEKSLKVLARNFDAESKVKFKDLPAEAQTALASFSFQYGENMNKHRAAYVQKVWKAYTSQNYKDAIALLKDATEYSGRRRDEAALLKGI